MRKNLFRLFQTLLFLLEVIMLIVSARYFFIFWQVKRVLTFSPFFLSLICAFVIFIVHKEMVNRNK